MRFRLSIAGLLAAVLLIAVGFAGLRTASALWASALFTLTVTLFATAILGAVVCRGSSRMAWLGFGIFGWTYLLATFWVWPGPNGVTAPPFLTKALLDSFQPSLKTSTVITIDTHQSGEMITEPPPIGAIRVIDLTHYRRIGHMLAAIVLAILGAVVGTLLSTQSEVIVRGTPYRWAPSQSVGMTDHPTDIVGQSPLN
jgi:hypothetical protein